MLRSLKIALVTASLLVGGVALADHGKDGTADHAGKREGFDRRAKRMAKFDLNKDGKLDQAERTAMFKARFDRLDKNHDGVLSFDEAQGMFARGGFHKRGMRGDHDRRGPDHRAPDHRPDDSE